MTAETRRDFLGFTMGALFAPAIASSRRLTAFSSRVYTVVGPVSPQELGTVLIHEHVLVDFVGADEVSPDRYDPDEVFGIVLPQLRRIRALGCDTLVECTPAYLGRDPRLLKRLSQASGIRLITNTGYYGAANHRYLPAHAFVESPEQLARRWIRESEAGIEGTGIKPGFIKIGVNKAPLSDIDRRLVQAAARTHRATGLTIASHTGNGAAALEQIQLLQSEGVHPSAFIWVHAQNEPDSQIHAKAASQGAWLEFEGFGAATVEKQASALKALIDRGFAAQVLISLDAGWYHVGEPGGGQFRAYEWFFTDVLPALRKAGINGKQIQMLIRENPGKALIPIPRLL